MGRGGGTVNHRGSCWTRALREGQSIGTHVQHKGFENPGEGRSIVTYVNITQKNSSTKRGSRRSGSVVKHVSRPRNLAAAHHASPTGPATLVVGFSRHASSRQPDDGTPEELARNGTKEEAGSSGQLPYKIASWCLVNFSPLGWGGVP